MIRGELRQVTPALPPPRCSTVPSSFEVVTAIAASAASSTVGDVQGAGPGRWQVAPAGALLAEGGPRSVPAHEGLVTSSLFVILMGTKAGQVDCRMKNAVRHLLRTRGWVEPAVRDSVPEVDAAIF